MPFAEAAGRGGIIYRYRTGVLLSLLATADAEGKLVWTVSVGATINRAHQHATDPTGP